MKIGVFSAERSRSFYAWMAALGYGIGLPLMVYDALEMIRHEFKGSYLIHGGIFYNAFGSLIVALGHVGLIMLIVQSGALSWLTRRLAAVGRMALSNYLTHSIVCTTLFYGYGFGLFGQINRTGLAAIVVAIWIFQLWMSPIWLRTLPLRPRRVDLAIADVLEAPADAARRCGRIGLGSVSQDHWPFAETATS